MNKKSIDISPDDSSYLLDYSPDYSFLLLFVFVIIFLFMLLFASLSLSCFRSLSIVLALTSNMQHNIHIANRQAHTEHTRNERYIQFQALFSMFFLDLTTWSLLLDQIASERGGGVGG